MAEGHGRQLYFRVRLILSLVFLPLAAAPSHALVEPEEREMRGAFVTFLKESLVSQGALANSACDVGGKGCSVVLLDMRRDYRLVAFKKRDCRVAGDTAFVCRFDAKVTCAYLADGKPKGSGPVLRAVVQQDFRLYRDVPLPGARMGDSAFRFRLTRCWNRGR